MILFEKESSALDRNHCELDRLDTLVGHQFLGRRLDLAPITMHQDDLEAPFVGHVGVERGPDVPLIIVLDLGDAQQEVPLLLKKNREGHDAIFDREGFFF